LPHDRMGSFTPERTVPTRIVVAGALTRNQTTQD